MEQKNDTQCFENIHPVFGCWYVDFCVFRQCIVIEQVGTARRSRGDKTVEFQCVYGSGNITDIPLNVG